MSVQANRDHSAVEDAWLNRLADEAGSEGMEGAVSIEEMATMLGSLT
jgi:hypothetical protein